MALTIGILLLLTFVGFIVYAVRGGNLMIGFLVMAVIWSTLGMIGGELTWERTMTEIFQGGPESWGPTAVVVVFGSWFGQVLVRTGVASKIIRMTVELGGDKPLITTVLLSVVTGLIFTSTFGAGAVVAIGVIVLPILLSLGVPKSLAVSSYIMSVGSGMYVNIVLFKQMQAIFTDFPYDGNYLKFGFTAMAVQLLIVILMLSVRLRKTKVSRAWAATASSSDNQNVPGIALITPLIPVVLAIGFNWQPIPAFIVAALFALFVTGKIRSYKDAEKVISKTFYDGVVDVAGLLGFLFILPMFNKVSGAVSPFFESILGGVMPTSTLTVALLFMVIAPLGLFRGPLTVFGAGAATIGILTGVGDFPLAFLFPLMYIPTITMNISACPTQSWNLWSINYTKTDTKSFLLSGVPWAWSVAIVNIAIAYLMFG
ncbi:citrate transporter [Neobacillus notoginsengisoli]|uniref:Citrate transporter n=1 Tax=Neobacillus notoginsengisoli TaxID=1578198 RepID=A0A417YSY3_9BACI|nr:citrate transporter [Neobacillus notoginsengisoli]RHW39101.1 citrate transporter [Neobacillus notoginsengisoli]